MGKRIQEALKTTAKWAGVGLGVLFLYNLAHDSPDQTKGAIGKSLGQTATGLTVVGNLAGGTASEVAPYVPIHIDLTNPFSSGHTTSEPAANRHTAVAAHETVHKVVPGDDWWGILGKFGLNGAQIQQCVADKGLNTGNLPLKPGSTVGNPC